MSAAIIINILLFFMEAYGTMMSLKQSGLATFRFYTVISNTVALLASALYLLSAIWPTAGLDRPADLFRYLATCMLTLTFLIVIFVLTPLDVKDGINPIHLYVSETATIHHVIAPVLSFLSFVFLENHQTLVLGDVFLAMGVTLVYAVVLLILNIRRVLVGPYPFLEVYHQTVRATVLWFLGIGAFAFALDLLILYWG